MIKVMVFGTFDGLHPGHLDFFRQAKVYGDYLIVVVARDLNVKKYKGQRPQFNENARLKAVKKSPLVNRAALGYLTNRFKIIKELKPEVVCLGYDQKMDLDELRGKLAELKIKAAVHRLQPFQPEKYKSSLLRNDKLNGAKLVHK
ncbi:MAG: adenylyltransferase/cytidyltransferase family protein [Patescibacteria group bacterium]|jgi:FAD synthetase